MKTTNSLIQELFLQANEAKKLKELLESIKHILSSELLRDKSQVQRIKDSIKEAGY